MAKQTGRSLKLSAQGRQKADIALQKFAGKRDFAANLGMSPTTVTNFFAGRPVKRREFHEICKKLRLNWQEVADLPQQDESEPVEKLQNKGSDIDELVREVRSLYQDKIQYDCGEMQLLNRQVPINDLYTDVYILEDTPKLRSLNHQFTLDLSHQENLSSFFDDNLALALDQTLAHDYKLAYNYDFSPELSLDYDLAHGYLPSPYTPSDFYPELQRALKKLQEQFPYYLEDENLFNNWWQANGSDWTEGLIDVMIEHRDIGHDLQLSEEEKKLLQQYYDANEVLVDCLNSGCKVSDKVIEKIEETLLLPIAEIEKRQPQM